MFPLFTGIIASSIAALSSITWTGNTQCYSGSPLVLFTAPRATTLGNGIVLYKDVKRLEPYDNGYFTFDDRKYVSDFTGTIIDNFQCLLSSLVSFSSCSAEAGMYYVYSTEGIKINSFVYDNEDKSEGSAIEDDTFFYQGTAFSTREAGEIFDAKALVFSDQFINFNGEGSLSDDVEVYTTTSSLMGVGDFVFYASSGDCAEPVGNSVLYQTGAPGNDVYFWLTNDIGRIISRQYLHPTAPTVAPSLSVLGVDSFIVDFAWSPSDMLDSEGFQYVLQFDVEGSGWTPQLTFGPDAVSATVNYSSIGSGNYMFRIVPQNNVGEGPPSNTVVQFIPA